jgi:hypothetical protein
MGPPLVNHGLSHNPIACARRLAMLIEFGLFEDSWRAAPIQTWAMQAKDCGQLGEGLWQTVANGAIFGADLTSCANHSA